MANDRLGDCTCAAAGHLIQGWTTSDGTGSTYVASDAEIITAYSAVSGYDPKTGANDNGAVCLDVLNYWRHTGIAGHKIYAYAALEPQNQSHIEAAVDLFGGVYIGIALPISIQDNTQPNSYWSVSPGYPNGDEAPGSWGGHCVPIIGYNARTLTFVTWGMVMYMTWNFWRDYCDEAYAVLSQNWAPGGTITAPSGFNLSQLNSDLGLVQGSAAARAA